MLPAMSPLIPSRLPRVNPLVRDWVIAKFTFPIPLRPLLFNPLGPHRVSTPAHDASNLGSHVGDLQQRFIPKHQGVPSSRAKMLLFVPFAMCWAKLNAHGGWMLGTWGNGMRHGQGGIQGDLYEMCSGHDACHGRVDPVEARDVLLQVQGNCGKEINHLSPYHVGCWNRSIASDGSNSYLKPLLHHRIKRTLAPLSMSAHRMRCHHRGSTWPRTVNKWLRPGEAHIAPKKHHACSEHRDTKVLSDLMRPEDSGSILTEVNRQSTSSTTSMIRFAATPKQHATRCTSNPSGQYASKDLRNWEANSMSPNVTHKVIGICSGSKEPCAGESRRNGTEVSCKRRVPFLAEA